MGLISHKNRIILLLLKGALLVLFVGLLGYGVGYFFEKKKYEVSISSPGKNPSILCLRVEFPDHKMRMLDLEWKTKLTRLIGQANTYWKDQLYGTFQSFQEPKISAILTLNEPADAYLDDLDKIYQDSAKAAKAAGIAVEDFDHVLMSYPSVTETEKAWGSPGKIWYPGEIIEPPKLVHEIGHSFGLGHCALEYRDSSRIDPKSPPSTDPWFMMGEPSLLFFTPLPLPMRFQLEALTESQVPLLKREPGKKSETLRLHDFRKSPQPGQHAGYRISGKDDSTFWIGYLTGPEETFDAGGLFPVTGLVVQRSQQYLVESYPATKEKHDIYPELLPKRLGLKKGEQLHIKSGKFTVSLIAEGADEDGHAWADVVVDFGIS